MANEGSKLLCLDWITIALARNSKRQVMHSNERLLAGDGFMLNLLSILQLICSNVEQVMVDLTYLHMDISRVNIKCDSRLKATNQEAMEFCEKLEKATKPNFDTECWFLTLHAHHIGLLPIIRKWVLYS